MPLLLAGIGSGLVISPNQTLTLANVPVQRAGSAGGVIQTGQRMGTAAGIALVGSVYFATLSSSHGDDARAAGYGLRIAAALTAVALCRRSRRRAPEPRRRPLGSREPSRCTLSVATPASTSPARLSASCSSEPRTSAGDQTARPSARLPSAGTVVTEMKTPTRAEAFPAVSEMTPATPASSATTNDQWSGCQMNPVSGRAWVTISGVTQPAGAGKQGQDRDGEHGPGERPAPAARPRAG